jgi:hypothetical protein
LNQNIKKKFAMGLFLDIDGAFDKTSFGSIYDAASGEHGIVITLRRWIDVMLCFRSARVDIRGNSVRMLIHKSEMPARKSTVDGLLRRLYNAHYQAQGYAVHGVLLQKGKFISTLYDHM